MTQANPADHELIEPTEIVYSDARRRGGFTPRCSLPKKPGRYPTLFAASPYRFDNDYAPAYPMYLWRQIGPIGWYVDHGYAFVHMDVRGTGRSGGEYRFFDEVEQRDLYDAIEWIAAQPWSDGNVGGIGQSYYAVMQWFMAIRNSPHLKCIAPYDGLVDVYRASAFSGGIPGASSTSGTIRSCDRSISTRRMVRRANCLGTCPMRRCRTPPTMHSGKSARPQSSSTGSRCRSIRSGCGPRSICT